MTAWFHRTCEHRRPRIMETLTLQPYPHPLLGNLSMVWLTSYPSATRAMLGLSSHTLECDRMAFLFQVVPEDEEKVMWWGDVMRSDAMVPYLAGARSLCAARGTRPGVWGVAAEAIRVFEVT